MEYASWLAGERWSDHPDCTHPLLASLARLINDHTSDDGRSRLVELIPSVIGLTGDDIRVDLGIAIRSAATAIPVVAEHRQRALAVSLLTSRGVLESLGDATSDHDTEFLGRVDPALAQVPYATRWAEQFTAIKDVTLKEFRRRAAPAAVRIAVVGIAEAAISDRDGMLYELLASTVQDCETWLGSTGEPAIEITLRTTQRLTI
jgi:hypothetical protein